MSAYNLMNSCVEWKASKQGWNDKWQIIPFGKNGWNCSPSNKESIFELKEDQALHICNLLNWSMKRGENNVLKIVRRNFNLFIMNEKIRSKA